ncbi:MAG: carbamate kinase [Kordiimonadaceae bacterium]|nr:carbamate kinase [Kordiimonadaceae bacterium]
MRINIALGGNALLRRGQALTVENQSKNVRIAAAALALVAEGHELVITHGNGPQVGLLALQGAAYKPDEAYPLDVLGAETQGMIGYMLEQELGNRLPAHVRLATLLTMIEVDPKDEAFDDPKKFVGPIYEQEEALRLAEEKNWHFKEDGEKWRRVVPSPLPQRIIEIDPITWLLEKNVIVICAGGGGIPTVFDEDGNLHGVEAVIDKDFSSELLARELNADLFIMVTDADAVYVDWGTIDQAAIKTASPRAIQEFDFPAGSMKPKVDAACKFAVMTGKPAAIGSVADLSKIICGEAGTTISVGHPGIEWHGHGND